MKKKMIKVFLMIALLISTTLTQCSNKEEKFADKIEKLDKATKEYSEQETEFEHALHSKLEEAERKKLENLYEILCRSFAKCIELIIRNPQIMKRKIYFNESSQRMENKPFFKNSYQKSIKKCIKKYGNSKKDCKQALNLFYNSYCFKQ